MSRIAALAVAAVATTGAALADELTIVNKFQWPANMRFEPIRPPDPAPPPTVIDQMADAYKKMPLRPAYVPPSEVNDHGAVGLQFHHTF